MFILFLKPLFSSISQFDICLWNWGKDHILSSIPRKPMSRNLHQAIESSLPLAPIASVPSITRYHDVKSPASISTCNGFWYDAFLVMPAVLFVVYLAVHAKKNLKKLCNGGSYIMISYYALLWFVTILNLAWCFLQVSLDDFSCCFGFLRCSNFVGKKKCCGFRE